MIPTITERYPGDATFLSTHSHPSIHLSLPLDHQLAARLEQAGQPLQQPASVGSSWLTLPPANVHQQHRLADSNRITRTRVVGIKHKEPTLFLIKLMGQFASNQSHLHINPGETGCLREKQEVEEMTDAWKDLFNGGWGSLRHRRGPQ